MKRFFALLCMVLLLSTPLSAACFTSLELKAVNPPQFCQNALAYEITYFKEIAGSKLRVYPTVAERKEDADLILAKVVWAVLEDAYFAHGKHLDEWSVDATTQGMVNHLVSHDFISAAWPNQKQMSLKKYMSAKGPNLQLHLMNVILDYQDEAGYHGGTDMNPILLHFSPQPVGVDKAVVIFVSVHDEYPVPPSKLPL